MPFLISMGRSRSLVVLRRSVFFLSAKIIVYILMRKKYQRYYVHR